MKEIITIENWELFYTPGGPVMKGDFPDGTTKYTSRITGGEKPDIIVTMNNRYRFGEPHPNYEKVHRGAKDRLVNEINKW